MRYSAPPDTTPRILDGYAGTPISLVAQVSLDPQAAIDLSTDALRNVFGERILIDSISWVADAQQSTGTTDPPTVVVGSPGASISATISAGDRPITAGFVPLYCLGMSEGQDVEHAVLGIATGGATACRLLGAYASGCWYLDHPLEMAPGDAFSMHLNHTGLQNLPIVVSFAIRGRLGKDLPSSNWIPYVSSWVAPSIDPTAPTATVPIAVTSTERDLVNRSGLPLHVHRLIGRILRQGVALQPGGAGTAYTKHMEEVFPGVEGTYSDQPTSRIFANAVDSFLTITMRDSASNDNVPNAIPFRMVFEPVTRAWECDADLEPSGYYLASLSLAVPGVTTDTAIQPAIAMIGSYEV